MEQDSGIDVALELSSVCVVERRARCGTTVPAGDSASGGVLECIQIDMKALAEVADVPLPARQKFPRFFRRLGLHAPFLRAGHRQRRVEQLFCRSSRSLFPRTRHRSLRFVIAQLA